MSLDAIKRRVQLTNRYSLKDMANEQTPLFKADVVLSIPQVVLKPSPEEIQMSLNKAVQVILKMFEGIPQWKHLTNQQKQQHKVCPPSWHEDDGLVSQEIVLPLVLLPTTCFIDNCTTWCHYEFFLNSGVRNCTLHKTVHILLEMLTPWWYFEN